MHKLLLCVLSVVLIIMETSCTVANGDLSIRESESITNASKKLHVQKDVVDLDGMAGVNDTFGEATYNKMSRHDTTETSSKFATLHRPVSTFSQELVPFAKRGDTFNLRISSVCDHILFEPVEFVNLTFDQSTLSITHPHVSRTLNLTMCALHNCTGEIRVEWEMKGQHFASSTSLVHFYPHINTVKHRLVGNKKQSNENLSNSSSGNTEGVQDNVYHSYIQQTLTLSPVVDFASPLPPQAQSFTPSLESSNYYGPAVYINNFWQIRDHMYEFNTTSTRDVSQLVNFTVDVMPIALWKVLIYEQYELSMKQQQAMGLASANDAEDTKRIFLETNPYFLALTALVTVLHMIFEYLAFSNDVKFWRGRKNFKGLSLRSILIKCYFQSIIFLYLLDSQETSWAILLPSGIGVLTEFWKLAQIATVTRVTDISTVNPSNKARASENTMETTTNDNECCVVTSQKANKESKDKVSSSSEWRIFGYAFSFKDSYDARTRRHDETAVRYLIYIMIPILLAYSVYSAVFDSHKSWYSFLIGTQVRFIYFFGFAMMTPQIFINYKMKSVGQMPWRMFVYKALNTVIDDLFAFIIKMPLLHRIACFRDDVVFVILLYQRWIYPVDERRIGDDDDNDVEDDSSEKTNTDDTRSFTEHRLIDIEKLLGDEVDDKQKLLFVNSTNAKPEDVTAIATSDKSILFSEKKKQEEKQTPANK